MKNSLFVHSVFRLCVRGALSAAVFALFCTSTSAATIFVNCGRPGAAGKIQAHLKYLDPRGPNTVKVAGTCNENVSVVGFDRLSLIAIPGAVLQDASGGTQAVLRIEDSQRVVVLGFTIRGGSAGAECAFYSSCHFSGNNISGAATAGVLFNQAEGTIGGDTLEGNQRYGLAIRGHSRVSLNSVVVQGNLEDGINAADRSSVEGQSLQVHDNGGHGLFLAASSFLSLANSTISANALNGVDLEAASSAVFLGGVSVTNNVYTGVVMVDLALVDFGGSGTYTGNGAADVYCAGKYSVARYLQPPAIWGSTNCQ
jgi:hypothetical protein